MYMEYKHRVELNWSAPLSLISAISGCEILNIDVRIGASCASSWLDEGGVVYTAPVVWILRLPDEQFVFVDSRWRMWVLDIQTTSLRGRHSFKRPVSKTGRAIWSEWADWDHTENVLCGARGGSGCEVLLAKRYLLSGSVHFRLPSAKTEFDTWQKSINPTM